jgi:hypothetical protein
MKYYDKINNRLIFIQNRAEEEFWESRQLPHPVFCLAILGNICHLIREFWKEVVV